MPHWLGLSVRWAARISGLLLVGLVTLIMVGEGGPPNFLAQPLPVQLEFVGIFLIMAGFLVGWRWEAVGGVAAVVGFLAFLGTELVVNGKPPGGAIPLFLIPAILLLISYALNATGWPPRRSETISQPHDHRRL